MKQKRNKPKGLVPFFVEKVCKIIRRGRRPRRPIRYKTGADGNTLWGVEGAAPYTQ